MASDKVDIAVGMTFSMTGFAGLNALELLDFTEPESSKEMENVSHQGSLKGHGYRAKKLKEGGTLVLIVHHDQDYDYQADVDAALLPVACTLTRPSGATVAFFGILMRYTPQQATLNDKMVAEVEIQVSNDTSASANPASQNIVVTGA